MDWLSATPIPSEAKRTKGEPSSHICTPCVLIFPSPRPGLGTQAASSRIQGSSSAREKKSEGR